MRHMRAGYRLGRKTAHRTSTLASADYIVALEGGRVAETGTHAELLARDGVYARFYHRQLLVEQVEDDARAPIEGLGGGA